MLVPWNSSSDSSLWLHYPILLIGDTICHPTGRCRLSRAEWATPSAKRNALEVRRRVLQIQRVSDLDFWYLCIIMLHLILFIVVWEKGMPWLLGFGPASLWLKRGSADANMNTGWLILGFVTTREVWLWTKVVRMHARCVCPVRWIHSTITSWLTQALSAIEYS